MPRGKRMDYYVLRPIYRENSVVYVPVENEQLQKKMRRALSAQEIERLIDQMPQQETIWIENENERKLRYRQILAGGDRGQIVSLIKTLYLHERGLAKAGRKLHLCDERFFKEAERMLYDEFSHVLGISKEEVLPMIVKKLEERN